MAPDESKKKPPVKVKKFRGEVFIEWEMCKGCGFCVEFCPMEVLVLSKDFNAKGYHPPMIQNGDRCTGCNLCGSFCPDFSIFARRVEADDEGGEQPA